MLSDNIGDRTLTHERLKLSEDYIIKELKR
jgi:hypothetical protein